MPTRIQDNHDDESSRPRSSGGRTRERDRDKDKDRAGRQSRGSGNNKRRSTTKDKDKEREKHHRRRPTSREGSGGGGRSSSSTPSLKDSDKKKKDSAMQDQDTGADVANSGSRPVSVSGPANESRTSLPYPAFSKAHSKEAVGDRDKLGKLNILTPEPTDLTDGPNQRNEPVHATSTNNGHTNGNGEKTAPRKQTTNANSRPPSPPLTNEAEPTFRRRSTPTMNKRAEDKATATVRSHEDEKQRRPRPQSSRASHGSLKKAAEQHAKSSGKASAATSTGKFKILDALQFPHRSSSSSSQHVISPKQKSHEKADSRRSSGRQKTPYSPRASTATAKDPDVESTAEDDSDATYIAPIQVQTQPTVHSATHDEDLKKKSSASTAPPPPPPPPHVPMSMPKVDYLLQCGGLGHYVPRNFLGAGESANMPQELFRPERVGHQLFEPFSTLLEDYEQVMTKGGSLAVATGYRSVARRLLDRLEAVFARDISSETCGCLMCSWENLDDEHQEEASGVSWGEILEAVSGRQDLPPWPPFSMGSEADPTAGISVTEQHVPMQKLDIDVPEEYREHYIRQSRKTKETIDKWLSRQPHQSNSLPEDVDDETLTFAMLTYLGEEQRDLFKGLLEIPTTPPVPKKETPKPKERPQTIVLGSKALQRLYRLAKPPRDPETALYMVGNPQMHHVLATLAAISNDEWDILISGRFDGFLRSGAEDDGNGNSSHMRPLTGGTSTSPSASRSLANGKASRSSTRDAGNGTTGPQRPSSAASFGAPISVDEESEIAALAEIERDIFLGMEALEDAFETLHVKAETIRRAIRERGAGLTAARARRGVDGVEVFAGTPSPGWAPGTGPGGMSRNEDDNATDDGLDDVASIAPSDSASNISSSRRRRPKRRTERRTPSAVEEEDEES